MRPARTILGREALVSRALPGRAAGNICRNPGFTKVRSLRSSDRTRFSAERWAIRTGVNLKFIKGHRRNLTHAANHTLMRDMENSAIPSLRNLHAQPLTLPKIFFRLNFVWVSRRFWDFRRCPTPPLYCRFDFDRSEVGNPYCPPREPPIGDRRSRPNSKDFRDTSLRSRRKYTLLR